MEILYKAVYIYVHTCMLCTGWTKNLQQDIKYTSILKTVNDPSVVARMMYVPQ